MENKAFKINGIKMLMEKNYKVNSDLLDLNSYINDSLSMRENWFKLKPKIILLSNVKNIRIFK